MKSTDHRRQKLDSTINAKFNHLLPLPFIIFLISVFYIKLVK